MQVVNVEQKSPEWFALRERRMTASHASAIAANGKGLESYINKMMYEYYSTAEPERFSNRHTDRGNELEDSAAFIYSTGIEEATSVIGFVIHDDYTGCSPDLFVGEKGGCELKCPDDKEYFRLLMGGAVKSEYVWQIQMTMMICGKDWFDFGAYNPNFKKDLVKHRLEPDQKAFDKLKIGLESGEKMIKEIQAKMGKILQ